MRTRPPGRPPDRAVRPREYLTPEEVERLRTAAASRGRHGPRDAAMILLAYRHGLRASELVGLERAAVFPDRAQLYVRRVKGGLPGLHPLGPRELRALNKVLKGPGSKYVFRSERGGPLTVSAFAKIVARAGRAAGIPFPVHPHMLRHACGYKLANDGQDTRAIQHYLGHRNIRHTVRYTALSGDRFQGFWED